MSRIASDAVALAVDNQEAIARQFASHAGTGRKVAKPFKPHRLFGLAARLLARSNCIEDRPECFRDGAFAEPGQTRHAGWKP